MPTLLHLDSSADLATSTSRELTALVADTWRTSPEHVVVHRDLHADPLPHLPGTALHWAPALRRDGETADPAAEALQQQLVAEVLAADAVVLGAPMYQWTVPSTLKAWLDHVHVLGTTAPFGGSGQPFAGTPVVVVASRGAGYAADDPVDHVGPLLHQVLGTSLGMAVTVVVAELTLAGRVPAMAPRATDAESSLDAARARLVELARSL